MRPAEFRRRPAPPLLLGGAFPIIAVLCFAVELGAADTASAQCPVRFAGAKATALSQQAVRTIAADFDRDGLLDLAVVSFDPNVPAPHRTRLEIMLATGDGAFRSAATYPLDALTAPFPVGTLNAFNLSLISGDFNGDRIPDLVITDRYNGGVSLLIGMGDGTFRAPVRVADSFGLDGAVAADFNGDGNQDLAIIGSNYADTTSVPLMTVLLGHGDGTFRSPIPHPDALSIFMSNFEPGSVVTGDFNGDGHIDILLTFQLSAAVYELLGNGDGSFRSALPVPLGSDYFFTEINQGQHLLAADFSGDGVLDFSIFAAGGSNPRQLSFLGRGDGTFRSPIATGGFGAFGAADINGDGMADLLGQQFGFTSSGLTSLAVAPGKGDGTFGAPVVLGQGPFYHQSVGAFAGNVYGGDGADFVFIPDVEFFDAGMPPPTIYTYQNNTPGISITPATVPAGMVGVSYGWGLAAKGGDGPYTYTLASGLLPAGISLTATGDITGVPVAAGAFDFSVAVKGSGSCQSGLKKYSMAILPAQIPAPRRLLPLPPRSPVAVRGRL